jgi:hypothetical protein
MLNYQEYTNLENSLKDFLDTQVNTDSVTDINGTNVPVRVGRKESNDWTLPCISEYQESETSSKFEIGSTNTDDRFLIILDVFATNDREQKDIARWLKEILKSGWRYYSYSYNSINPESPTKVAGGWVNVNFIENTKVALGQNVDVWDAHRHKISISVWISGS